MVRLGQFGIKIAYHNVKNWLIYYHPGSAAYNSMGEIWYNKALLIKMKYALHNNAHVHLILIRLFNLLHFVI